MCLCWFLIFLILDGDRQWKRGCSRYVVLFSAGFAVPPPPTATRIMTRVTFCMCTPRQPPGNTRLTVQMVETTELPLWVRLLQLKPLGCSKHLLKKKNLPKVQNSGARLVLKAGKPNHVSYPRTHWLNLSTLCHSLLSNIAPVYMSDLLYGYSPSRQFHSFSYSRTYHSRHVKTETFGCSSFFSTTAPSVGNSLPRETEPFNISHCINFKTAV